MTGKLELKVILTADLQGFSTRLKEDEAAGLEVLGKFQALVAREVEACGGVVFRREGDGVWCSFASASKGLEAGIAIHRAIEKMDEKLALRMGVHLGEVSVDGIELVGHGLSVAKRLETSCPVGGIAFSEEVRAALATRKLPVQVQDLGTVDLKGVGPRRVFVAVVSSAIVPARPGRRAAIVVGTLCLIAAGVAAVVVPARQRAQREADLVRELETLPAADALHLLVERRKADPQDPLARKHAEAAADRVVAEYTAQPHRGNADARAELPHRFAGPEIHLALAHASMASNEMATPALWHHLKAVEQGADVHPHMEDLALASLGFVPELDQTPVAQDVLERYFPARVESALDESFASERPERQIQAIVWAARRKDPRAEEPFNRAVHALLLGSDAEAATAHAALVAETDPERRGRAARICRVGEQWFRNDPTMLRPSVRLRHVASILDGESPEADVAAQVGHDLRGLTGAKKIARAQELANNADGRVSFAIARALESDGAEAACGFYGMRQDVTSIGDSRPFHLCVPLTERHPRRTADGERIEVVVNGFSDEKKVWSGEMLATTTDASVFGYVMAAFWSEDDTDPFLFALNKMLEERDATHVERILAEKDPGKRTRAARLLRDAVEKPRGYWDAPSFQRLARSTIAQLELPP